MGPGIGSNVNLNYVSGDPVMAAASLAASAPKCTGRCAQLSADLEAARAKLVAADALLERVQPWTRNAAIPPKIADDIDAHLSDHLAARSTDLEDVAFELVELARAHDCVLERYTLCRVGGSGTLTGELFAQPAVPETGDGAMVLHLQLAEARETLARLGAWADTYGAALVPHGGAADTFGDGVRACKAQVKTILSELARRGTTGV